MPPRTTAGRRARYLAAGPLVALALLVRPLAERLLPTADGRIETASLERALLWLSLALALSGAALLVRWRSRLVRRFVAVALPALVLVTAAMVGRAWWPHRLQLAWEAEIGEEQRILGRASLAARTGRIELARETGETIYRPGRAVERLRLEVPPGAMLDTAVGVDPVLATLTGARLRFEMTAVDEKGERIALVSREFDLADDDPDVFAWHHLRIDLAQLAGRRLELELEKAWAAPEGGAGWRAFDLAPTDLMYWRQPRLRPHRLEGRKNLILVSLDTVSAGHLGFMGYGRDTSPALDDLATRGVVFERTISQAPWTRPSHLSLLTSTYPSVHGGVHPPWALSSSWDERLPTLAGLLREAGYLTGAFVGQGTVSAAWGLDRGFDFYNETVLEEGSDARLVMEKAGRWLRGSRDRSFFLFVHTFEPHWPFQGRYFVEREGLDEATEDDLRVALYDGDLRETDLHLGRLLELLGELGLEDDTLIVVTSDHGEELRPRYWPGAPWSFWGHGHNLYDDVLHVPLLLAGFDPDAAGRRVPQQVRLIDVVPTVLDYLGLEAPPELQGRSLRALIEGRPDEPRPAYSEATTFGADLESLRVDGWKYVHRRSYGHLAHRESLGMGLPPVHQLYDLASDPAESRDLATARPEEVERLAVRMAELAGSAPGSLPGDAAAGPETVSPELLRSLRALGYVD